jgi:excinuclease UvrABC helicase subunit UvrB
MKMAGDGDWLLVVVDKSHVTLPQLKAMYAGIAQEKSGL